VFVVHMSQRACKMSLGGIPLRVERYIRHTSRMEGPALNNAKGGAVKVHASYGFVFGV